ncbi:unnamed protein product [Sphenostylis stenocarpa]|uniref:Uncharacterized protein n=1 Tax=Sphenostylis stenocarpa TaxID=92480 RepID=A0AA86TC82_9FABA|nr:unnamed protein product [Sphenostylis stenocarpa]
MVYPTNPDACFPKPQESLSLGGLLSSSITKVLTFHHLIPVGDPKSTPSSPQTPSTLFSTKNVDSVKKAYKPPSYLRLRILFIE